MNRRKKLPGNLEVMGKMSTFATNISYKTYNQLDFATYCIGSVAERLGMNQLAVYEKLKRSNILDGYIIPAYDLLHTYSGEYITDELVDCLREKGELQ